MVSLTLGLMNMMFMYQLRSIRSFSIVSSYRGNGNGILGNKFSSEVNSIATIRKTFLYNSQQPVENDVTEKSISKEEAVKLIPITLLSGFLGSGKTTTLKHLLENSDNVKIGVVVNDVASINIDAKLISSTKEGFSNTVELQNGCACCSLADELLTSVEGLVQGRELDEVVVELSGVADPASVQANWEEAVAMGHPATKLANITRIVTLVDACTFGSDFMTWNTAGEREGWVEDGDECASEKKISELLAEQVEVADVVLVNKVDLASVEQVRVAADMAKGLNKDALLVEVEHGRVKPMDIFNMNRAVSVLDKGEDCSTPGCTDSSHNHGHDDDCAKPDCTDTSHSHSSHDHDHASDSSEPDCTEPACTDPTHSHSHNHNHKSPITTAELGITNFVYKSPRPFHLQRLLSLLNAWPVPIKNELDFSALNKAIEDGYDTDFQSNDPEKTSPFVGVLRTKGFCWIAPSSFLPSLPSSPQQDDTWRHDTAMYWSHAGRQFGISTAGKWWGTISKEQMKSYFLLNLPEYERILKQDFVSDEFGDRRQELVFIGLQIDEENITRELDLCLLTEKEMDSYRTKLKNFMDTTLTTTSTNAYDDLNAGGLFDIESTEHLG